MKILLAAVLIALCSNLIFGNNAELEKIVKNYNSEKNFNGVALVATDGKIDFIKAVGQADRKRNLKMAPDSKFRIASITKTFTAVLVLKLYEAGKIDLNAVIGKYFPEYKGEGRDRVTIHQLLTYSSGIANLTEKEGMAPYKAPVSLDGFIEKYCSGKLEFEPGAKSVYANTEYIILGKIIEKITGKTFSEVVQEQILLPLKMKSTGAGIPRKTERPTVKSYTINEADKTFTEDEKYLIETYFASGAMFSTAEDLLEFSRAIFSNKLLKPETTKLMLKIDPKLGNAAYGFWGADAFGSFDAPFYYRPGGILGSTANWIHVPGTNRTIIVLSNTNATNLFELSDKLYAAGAKK